MAQCREPGTMEMVESPSPGSAGVFACPEDDMMQSGRSFDEQQLHTWANQYGADAEETAASHTTHSGLSYAEHMLHDTLQMTRRSAAAASARTDRDASRRDRTVNCAVSTAALRAKTSQVPSTFHALAPKRRPGSLSQPPKSNCTLPKPFKLAVDQRASSPRAAPHKNNEGGAAARPATPVPGRISPHIKTGYGMGRAQASRPVTQPRPFQLQSVVRHDWKMQQLRKAWQLEVEEETRARQFKARPYFALNKPRQCKPPASPPRQPRAITPKPFNLESERRHQQYVHKTLPERMRREALKEELEAQAMRERMEREAAEIRRLRKRLQFKARPAPPRMQSAFEPDFRLAKPPTQPKPFRLATSRRLDTAEYVSGTDNVRSHRHSISPCSDEDEVEDDEDLDDGSGCTDLDDSRDFFETSPHAQHVGGLSDAPDTGGGYNDTHTVVQNQDIKREMQLHEADSTLSTDTGLQKHITAPTMEHDTGAMESCSIDAVGVNGDSQQQKHVAAGPVGVHHNALELYGDAERQAASGPGACSMHNDHCDPVAHSRDNTTAAGGKELHYSERHGIWQCSGSGRQDRLEQTARLHIKDDDDEKDVGPYAQLDTA